MRSYRDTLLDKVDKKYFYEKLSICDKKTAWIEFYSSIFLVASIVGSVTFASATIESVVHNYSGDFSFKLLIFWLFLLFFGGYSAAARNITYQLNRKAYVNYIIHSIVTVAFICSVFYLFGEDLIVTAVTAGILFIIWLIPNLIYFKKRKEFFYTEYTLKKELTEKEAEKQAAEYEKEIIGDTSPIIFSRELAKPEKKKNSKYD